MKVCRVCKEEKPLESFFRDRQKKDGRAGACKPCEKARHKQWRATNPEKVRVAWKNSTARYEAKGGLRFKKYGLTALDYETMVAQVGGCCEICGTFTKLNVDHDHLTGKVRGLLCRGCNCGIGQMKDNPEILQSAIEYLVRGAG